jgi:hypothetical protein
MIIFTIVSLTTNLFFVLDLKLLKSSYFISLFFVELAIILIFTFIVYSIQFCIRTQFLYRQLFTIIKVRPIIFAIFLPFDSLSKFFQIFVLLLYLFTRLSFLTIFLTFKSITKIIHSLFFRSLKHFSSFGFNSICFL